MRKILFILSIAFSLSSFSQTQAEMNREASAQYAQSDKKLNTAYKTILTKYKDDQLFLTNLKKSQRLWIQFRDAELAMKFPEYPEGTYGSIQPMCRAYYLKELTDKRTQTLNVWVHGGEEGDGCNGSLKTRYSIDSDYSTKAMIRKDSSIWLQADMKRDHRIFGYQTKDINSTKVILLSIFTDEVKNNPFGCKYGAFYESNDMKDLKLKFVSIEGDFLRVEIMKNGKIVDQVYMLKKGFEFEG